jgi:hypothetical protein
MNCNLSFIRCSLFVALWVLPLAISPGEAVAQQRKGGAIKMDTLTVQGELQKPQASYIVQRSARISLSEDLKSKAPAVSLRIAETLDDELFEPRP